MCYKNNMIKYTIENKGGVHHVSNSFDINENIVLIRIINKSLILKDELPSPILIITDFSINGIKIAYESFFSIRQFLSNIDDFPIDIFIKSTNDIKIEIKENSKMEVQIFTKEIIKSNNPLINYATPTINK